jgi:hypothetical protein
MANEFYGKGITVTAGFDLGAKAPLDSRTVVNTLAERDAHVTGNRAYIGMKVYVIAENKEYLFDGSTWVEAGGVTEAQESQLTAAYEHSQTPHVSQEDLHSHDNKDVLDSLTAEKVASWDGKSEFSGNYNDLTNVPTDLATHSYVEKSIADLIGTSPDIMDTLEELSNALGNDENFAATITTELSNKADKSELHSHENMEMLGSITTEKIAEWDNKSSFSGLYDDLINIPTDHATLDYVNGKFEDATVFDIDMPTVSALGGITAGSNLNGMTALEILGKLLFPYVAPTYSVSSTPNGGTFEKGNTQTITSVKVTVTKKSEKITKIEIYDETELLGVKEGVEVENGGTFNFDINVIANSINKKITVIIYDASGKSYTARTNSLNFIYPYYIGVCGTNDVVDGTLVKGLTKSLETKGTKSISYNTNDQRMVLAYPKSYGFITKILDPNNFDVTSTFSRSTVSVVGLDGTAQDYYVYVNDASTVSNFIMKFSY